MSTKATESTPLKQILKTLNTIAPLRLTESWDNTGLLVEPPNVADIDNILLTNEFYRSIYEEAKTLSKKGRTMVIAYHPVIFSGLKKLTWGGGNASTALLVEAISDGIPIYCPHTCMDKANNGMTDWLISAFKGKASIIAPHFESKPDRQYTISVHVPKEHTEKVRESMARAGAGVIGNYSDCSFAINGEGTFVGLKGANPAIGEKGKLERVEEQLLRMVSSKRSTPAIIEAMYAAHPYEEPAWDIVKSEDVPVTGEGAGRVITLDEPMPLSKVVERVKAHLELKHVRLATNEPDAMVKSIATCPGAGWSVIGKTKADVYWTGEARHHDVLAALKKGSHVILCEHSNTERGFLKVLKSRLSDSLPNANIVISSTDRDPLSVV